MDKPTSLIFGRLVRTRAVTADQPTWPIQDDVEEARFGGLLFESSSTKSGSGGSNPSTYATTDSDQMSRSAAGKDPNLAEV